MIVPADKKWFARLVVAAAVADAMQSLDLAFPKVDEAQKKELAAARAALEGEKGGKAQAAKPAKAAKGAKPRPAKAKAAAAAKSDEPGDAAMETADAPETPSA